MRKAYCVLFLTLNLLSKLSVNLHKLLPNMMEIENLWWIDITNFSQSTYTAYLHLTKREKKMDCFQLKF